MRLTTLVCATLFTGAFMAPAHAYLDPGTGSIVLQALLGGIAVAGATASMYWQKVRSLFSRRDQEKK